MPGGDVDALLVRVRERIETDLSDDELTNLITEAQAAIIQRLGPYTDPENPLTVRVRGMRRRLTLVRPIDTTQPVTIAEHTFQTPGGYEWWPGWDWDGWNGFDWTWDLYASYWELFPTDVTEVITELDPTDWRAWYVGRQLQRLPTGVTPRLFWGPVVDVTYTPVDDGAQRDEVTIKLVQLSVEYEGVLERRVGDVQTVHGVRSSIPGVSALVYAEERERLIFSLQPRTAVTLR